MGNEKKLVVNPLKNYFLNKNRSGANWRIKDEPTHETAATGWDLQVERHNQVLLIEAKYFSRSFISSFGGLVTAPLTNRAEKMRSKKRKSWSAVNCWAIGSGYNDRNIYQILFDYLARNIEFYNAYHKLLNVKYIFFVSGGKVSTIRFDQLIKTTKIYMDKMDSAGFNLYGRGNLMQKRIIANKLVDTFKFK